ncbi:hypothetical protein MPTK1_3g06070 [Marchantia polymorpha subsp. ruderalis]|uniref:Protein kinase domain-containing protein n=2 Tax=Marchantia polymorpha TaxID=3197 RepID=A0A176VV97_MARPO|nr:hypothetical protein AXG93_2016s1350 [Marchantia polymorpha subsp. ruderalis]PTQ48038.1 hypothetical protein MARPO_0006s0077 [Marchantia polymorpha]BBN04602.1 hypothetical protein Mp_3g06070 [Marchantia polymorpha subsp. ruderalis]|eukprot:PTQ48038.1 hypothetical protein MARPO_0006s0077 [Marchantia polymorpha]
MMTPAVKRLVLNEDVWKIIEEEEERPIESSIFPRGEKGDDIVVVPSFDGNKTWRESLDWLYRYSQWANQEGLSDDKALLYALMHMKHKAGRWGQQFPRSGTWPDFLKGFFERYIPTVDCRWFLQWYRNERKKNQIIWYTARELSKATNYFSEGNCIGEDRLGKIYKGSLPNEGKQPFAVKKYKKDVKTDSLLEVIKETRSNRDVLAFGHPNVLKLLGFAFSERNPLLMYDLVPNGSLEQHLQSKTEELYWGSRLTVAIDVADAIRHLHSSNYSQTPICRRDVRSSNILLDNSCRAKLGEFGIEDDSGKDLPPSPSLKPGVSKIVDPLKLKSGPTTKKNDVYSYGVVLMELVSGKKAWVSEVPTELFPDLWQMKQEAGKLDDILDPYLKSAGIACVEAFQEVIFLAVKCCSKRVDAKQTMATVATELRAILRKGVTSEIQRLSKLWKEAIDKPQPGSVDSCMRLVERLERVIDHPSLKSDVSRLLDPFKNLKSSLFEDLKIKEGVYEKGPTPPPPQGYRLDNPPPIRRSGFDGAVTPRPSFFDGPMTRAPPTQFTQEMAMKLKQLL